MTTICIFSWLRPLPSELVLVTAARLIGISLFCSRFLSVTAIRGTLRRGSPAARYPWDEAHADQAAFACDARIALEHAEEAMQRLNVQHQTALSGHLRLFATVDLGLEIARPGLPNSTPFFILAGYMSRRQNRWAEGERDFQTAVQLDPRNPNAYNLLSDTYILERRFPKAMESYRRVLATGPATPVLLIRGAQIEFAATGDGKSLQAALAQAPAGLDIGGGTTPLRVWQALIKRDSAEAQRLLAISPRDEFQDVDFTFYYRKHGMKPSSPAPGVTRTLLVRPTRKCVRFWRRGWK